MQETPGGVDSMTRARSRLSGVGIPALWLFGDAALAALVAGPAETLLLFLLSPEIPLTLGGFVATFVALLPQIIGVFVILGPSAVLLGLALRVGRMTRRSFSVRYTIRFALFDAALLALASWHQWRTLGALLPPTSQLCLALATTTFVLAAVVALVLAIVDQKRPGAVGAPWVVALALGVLVSLAATGAVRRVKVEPPRALALPGFEALRGALVIEIPALDPDDVALFVERGSAETLASLAERGTSVALEPGRVADPVALHASLMTGQGPERHGVFGSVRYRPRDARRSFGVLPRGLLIRPLLDTPLWERIPVDESSLRVVSAPAIARALGVRHARIGDPIAERDDGRMGLVLPAAALSGGAVHDVAGERVECPGFGAVSDEFFDPPHQALASTEELERLVRGALVEDVCALRAATVAVRSGSFAWVSVRLSGHYRVAYQFAGWREDRPARGVSDREIAAYGRTHQRYVRALDPELATLVDATGGSWLVALVSPHGIRARQDADRLVPELLGRTTPTGSHAGPPPGLLIWAGDGVRPGVRITDAVRLESILPTILWAQGFPAAEDMGPIMTGAFDASFVRERPVIALPSYGVTAPLEAARRLPARAGARVTVASMYETARKGLRDDPMEERTR